MIFLIAIWALAEATVFFIVVDVPIMALGIRAGVKPALIGAVLAAIVAAIGGAAVWLWASTGPRDVIDMMIAVPGIEASLIAQTHAQWQDGGLIAMIAGSFSGVPYKLYALAAGSSGGGLGSLGLFMIASVIARLPRLAMVALVSGWAGPRLVRRIGGRAVWIIFALAWAGFYAIYWSVTGF